MREFRFVITPFCIYKCFFCHSESIEKEIALLLKPSDYEFMAVTRSQLPNLKIHLNYTVIKGMNDADEDFEALLGFARSGRRYKMSIQW